MDRADYVQKMKTILNDRFAFTLINHDPTLDIENDLNRFLLELKKEGFISDQEYKLSYSTGSRPARIYGLPKLHKKRENYPLRPVMSATKTVAYGLGKMLANRLNILRTSPYTMVSFDITSLFIKVPLTYTIDLILDKMYPTCPVRCKYKQRSRLCVECKKRSNFEYLLRIATSKTHFIFDKNMYVQHNGVAMGAPLAPIIADIFMSHLEETLMDRLKQNGVCQWYRYVEDTFVHGLMIKWDSFVPTDYKKASVVSMVQRALAICSTYSSLAIEFDNIRAIALHNCYPISFIDTRIGIGLSNHLKRSTISRTNTVGCQKQKMYVEIPYTGAATHSFKKKLSHVAAKLRPDLDVRVFARPPSSVQKFFQTKDPIPKYLQSDIVYTPFSATIVVIYMSVKQRGKQ
jgi:hypothetical protein